MSNKMESALRRRYKLRTSLVKIKTTFIGSVPFCKKYSERDGRYLKKTLVWKFFEHLEKKGGDTLDDIINTVM